MRLPAAALPLILFILNPAFAGASDSARAAFLRAELARHDELYFRAAAPEISDAVYDALRRELADLEGSGEAASQTTPDDHSGRFPGAAHSEPMLSLHKALARRDVADFHARVAAGAGSPAPRFVLEPKIDGMAISLVYEAGRFVRAVSRGDGRAGEDLTHNLLAVGGFPLELPAPDAAPARLEVRGEVYLPIATFEALNRARATKGLAPFSNPRNLAAGSLRLADPAEVAARGLRLAVFDAGAWAAADAPDTHTGRIGRLRAWGFPVLEGTPAGGDADQLWTALVAMEETLRDSPLPLDGIVVKVDSLALREQLGARADAPNWAVAWKFAPPETWTRLRGVTWQVGRTGVLTPVAELAPVELEGRRISRAGLHNAAWIRDRELHADDLVRLELAGEVIPQVAAVSSEARFPDAEPVAIPEACPACGAALESMEDRASLHCGNAACPARLARRLEYFAQCTGIRGLGPAACRQLADAGLVNNLADLFTLSGRAEAAAALLGQGSLDRLLAAINAARGADLARVIQGIGLPGIGAARARELAARIDRLDQLPALLGPGTDVSEILLLAAEGL
jgi:DNA ligase (NAD+)